MACEGFTSRNNYRVSLKKTCFLRLLFGLFFGEELQTTKAYKNC